MLERATAAVGFVLFWVAANVVLKQCGICVSETWVMKSGTCVFNDFNLMGNVAIDRFGLGSSTYGSDAPRPFGPLCPII
jgi:hypothetical protein